MAWDVPTGAGADAAAAPGGAGQPAVPGAAPAAAGAPQPSDAIVQLLMNAIKQSGTGQQQQIAPPVVPSTKTAATAMTSMIPIIGPAISAAMQNRNAAKINKAENDWTEWMSTMEKYRDPQTGQFDRQAAGNDPWYDDPANLKKLEKMSKTLNVDWLNPKRTPEFQGLTQALHKDQQKKQAVTGIRGLFQKLIQQRQQPQTTPEQRQEMGREVVSRAPMTRAMPADPKNLLEAVRVLGEQQRGQEELGLRKEELGVQLKAHIDELQYRRDALAAQIQEKRDALAEKKITDEDRERNSQALLELRQQGLEQQRELGEERLELAKQGTVKDRENFITTTDKDFREERTNAEKDANATYLIPSHKARAEGAVAFANYKIKRLQALASQIKEGKISSDEATQKLWATPDPKSLKEGRVTVWGNEKWTLIGGEPVAVP